MKEQTYLSAEISSADQKAGYDAAVKRILAAKCILARILVGTVPEFREYSYAEAEAAIIGLPEIATRRVRPDERIKTEAVQGLNTESKLPGEGEVTFDIVFCAIAKEGSPQKLYINIEAQQSVQLHYDLICRSIFYPARLLSEQLDREFTTDSYDKIKKVYSIWICMDSPEKSKKKLAANTIVQYRIRPEVLYPSENIPKMSFGRYDLFSTIFINLVPDTKKTNDELIGMLSTLLSNTFRADQKKQILETQYGLLMTRKIDREVQNMCNLSEGIEAAAIAKAEEKFSSILSEKDKAITEKDKTINEKNKTINEKDKAINEKDEEISRLKKLLAEANSR